MRLMPLYYLLFLVGWLILPFLGDSTDPLWFSFEKNFQQCNEYYWSVFTFTINFFPTNQTMFSGCYYWAWFVACEVQIFLVLPFAIWALTKMRSNTLVLSAALLVPFVAGLGINWVIVSDMQLSPQVFSPMNGPGFQWFLAMPYTKIPVVVLGVALGFMFDAKMNKGHDIIPVLKNRGRLGWFVVIAMLIFSIGVFAGGILLEQSINGGDVWTLNQQFVFLVFYRPLFTIAAATLVLPCFFGYFNTMKMILGSFGFRVIGRLSYGAYLCFPAAMCFYYALLPNGLMEFMDKTTFLFLSNIFVTYIFALCAYLLLEEPCRKL